MEGDLAYNNGKDIYMKLDGRYYQRVIGKGWQLIDESALPADINWSPMPDVQRAVYQSQLPGQSQ